MKQAQGLAGELLWLVVRCRPDLSYPVNLMSQCMLKNPQLALKIGAQILGYLKSAKHWGIKYLLTRTLDTLEVQTDSGFAQSHLDMRSQQCVILLWGGSPIHCSSTRQPFICRSTAESELVATLEGVAVGESYGEVVAELIGRMLISSVPTQWNGGEGLQSAGSLQGSVPMPSCSDSGSNAKE